MSAPPWIKGVRRTKVIGQQKSNENERLHKIFKELRLRYIKVVSDNIALRKALSKRRRRRPERRYEQEQEIAPGIAPGMLPDDSQEDVCEYTERLTQREDW